MFPVEWEKIPGMCSFCIESFHPAIVRWFYKNKPKVVRGQLSADHQSLEGTPVWESVLITSTMTNVISRPHFMAYKHEDTLHRLSINLFHLLGGKLVGWAVRAPTIQKIAGSVLM